MSTHQPPAERSRAPVSLFAGWAPNGRALPEPPSPVEPLDPLAPKPAVSEPLAVSGPPAVSEPDVSGPLAVSEPVVSGSPAVSGPAASELTQSQPAAAVGESEPAAETAEPKHAPPEPAAGAEPEAEPAAAPTSVSTSEDRAATSSTTASPEPTPSARRAPRPQEAGEWRGIVLVTGTDTDVGKTVVTAAIAASAQAAGLRVAVVKPGQTGTAGGPPTDIDVVNRLATPHSVRTLMSYPDPLAPLAAARVAGLAPLELYEVVDAIRADAAKHDLVLVEGAGGLLVPMGVRPSGDPWTFADLAVTLGVGAIVVSRAGLGTLNHTALTLEALARRGVPAKVVLGAWPADPELVHWANLSELVPDLVGALPDGAGAMDPGVFRRSAPGWLTPALYGVVDNWRTWADEVS
jgi:dethiobiotin synthetase